MSFVSVCRLSVRWSLTLSSDRAASHGIGDRWRHLRTSTPYKLYTYAPYSSDTQRRIQGGLVGAPPYWLKFIFDKFSRVKACSSLCAFTINDSFDYRADTLSSAPRPLQNFWIRHALMTPYEQDQQLLPPTQRLGQHPTYNAAPKIESKFSQLRRIVSTSVPTFIAANIKHETL